MFRRIGARLLPAAGARPLAAIARGCPWPFGHREEDRLNSVSKVARAEQIVDRHVEREAVRERMIAYNRHERPKALQSACASAKRAIGISGPVVIQLDRKAQQKLFKAGKCAGSLLRRSRVAGGMPKTSVGLS